MTEQLILSDHGAVSRIRLNRPEALHALNREMCEAMTAALMERRTRPATELILLDHAEGRGFCAGGDVRAIAARGVEGGTFGRAFFQSEYRLNHLLFTYAKPIAVFMDGVVMGGGAGLALPCRYRIATERTLFAMPETAIGLFPDAGAGWHLSRLPGRVGQFVALTGARLDGAEALSLGLATHYLPSDSLEDVKRALIAEHRHVDRILAEASVTPPAARIDGNREAIGRLFAADRLEEILDALAADPSRWAAKELATLRTRSPQACKIALRLLADSLYLSDFADEMRLEYGIAAHVCQRHDFIEGVTALLIDKGRAPRWDPADPEDVTDSLIDRIFAPLPETGQWTPLAS